MFCCFPISSGKLESFCAFSLVFLCVAEVCAAPARFVDLGADGRLLYEQDSQGNQIPDFSHAGYQGGGVRIPHVPAQVVLSPSGDDETSRIQSAVDYVSQLPPDERGIRGAVVLMPGTFRVSGQVRITTSGVVLRGSGDPASSNPLSSILIATGNDRRPLIVLEGRDDKIEMGPIHQVQDSYVPLGTRRIQLDSASDLMVGDSILIRRPSPAKWINFMGMSSVKDRPSPIWKPNTVDIEWERRIVKIVGHELTLDAPLTCSLESQFDGGRVVKYSWPGRLRHVGVEFLQCISEWNSANPLDEEHSWMAVTMDQVEDAWVREVTARHFVSSAVRISDSCRRITVQDCASLAPVSEIGGYRRHSFYTGGQQTLFLRCVAEDGRHDFGVGWQAAGPNVFLHSETRNAHDFSGPIESWASGVLYDNLIMDGGGLRFDHREIWDNGVGWAAANCVAWQCSVPVITARTPPGASNWVIGCWAQFVGDASWRSPNEFVDPDSLYIAQLIERLGSAATQALEKGTPSPVHLSVPKLEDILPKSHSIGTSISSSKDHSLAQHQDWLIVGDQLLIGHQPGITWWRGHSSPSRADEFGINLTRFVPGQNGPGLTDPLPTLAEHLKVNGAAGLRHHWGLWYERRRDDHEMIRRIDGNVWPPFYEQPWARSGIGKAWDGLSRYDLTQYNPWYFSRIRQFAELSRTQGLCLINAMYFQHNILEAGAHWAEFPWRSANNINQTGFEEPPPYVNRKRIFMAEEFYDITHPLRRDLHRRYIRQCLSNLIHQPNVLHVLGEEYSGPLHFMEFWLDTVAEWKSENPGEHKVLVGLSAPKEVQDAILSDASRQGTVDVIDFKYWWLSPKGLYAPAGNQNLAPRQHERLWRGGRPTDETLAEMVAEYREKYPGKAIISDFPQARWAYLCAGGSMPNLPFSTEARIVRAVPRMSPWQAKASEKYWALREKGQCYLVYSGQDTSVELDLSDDGEVYRLHEVLPSGVLSPQRAIISGGGKRILTKADPVEILWLERR